MTEGRLPELSEVERRIGERAKLQGRQEGRQEGQRELLLRQLRARFGDLQPAVTARIESASVSDIERWAERVVTSEADTPEDVLA